VDPGPVRFVFFPDHLDFLVYFTRDSFPNILLCLSLFNLCQVLAHSFTDSIETLFLLVEKLAAFTGFSDDLLDFLFVNGFKTGFVCVHVEVGLAGIVLA